MTLKQNLKIIAIASAVLGCLAVPRESQARLFGKKKTKQEKVLTGEAKDSADMVSKMESARKFDGMFDCRVDKEGSLFFMIPDSAFNHVYLLTSRVNGISNTGDLVAGQMNMTPIMIRFTKDDKNVYMHRVQEHNEIAENDPIKKSFDKNMLDPVLKGFKIKRRSRGKVIIDVTSFFSGDEKVISPIKDADPLAKMLSGRSGIEGNFYKDGSNITEVKAFPDNIIIRSQLAYTTDKAAQPYTVNVSRLIMRLPDQPMRSRLHDNRVGFFYDNKKLYTSAADRIEQYGVINRFRLEPKEEDMQAYFAGQLVEPKKKIRFYVDSAFPDKWRKSVKEGILYWNTAFEAAGFKNAIEVFDYPEGDSEFDPDDVRFNCVRYSVTPTANAMGPSYTDPRSGEVLGGDVIWYHNVISLVHDWRFVQTGAVDPRVRTKTYADSVMHESLTYVTAHEIGHVLGLMHNMGASYAYTIDNLRDPAFTQKYGTTPSIMDYARNNYVAQPGDYERGVRLTPPPVGVYDINAIRWGYKLIPDAKTMFDEKPVLDRWIEEKEDNPMYEFGAQQVLGLIDPTDQTEDLSNDHITAGSMAVSNLKIIMDHFEEWAGEPGKNYDDELLHTYKALISQYMRHVGHVLPYIGGVRFQEVVQGHDRGPKRNYFSKKDMRRAMDWLLDQARTNDWISPVKLNLMFEDPEMEWRDKMNKAVVGTLLSSASLGRIKRGYQADPANGYEPSAFVDDALRGIFAKLYKGGKITDTDRKLQSLALIALTKNAGLQMPGTSFDKSFADASWLDADPASLIAVPASIPCSFDAIRSDKSDPSDLSDLSDLSDESRNFFRIVFGNPPMPDEELNPMMYARLKKLGSLYRSAAQSAPDASTREFYDYQARTIHLILNP